MVLSVLVAAAIIGVATAILHITIKSHDKLLANARLAASLGEPRLALDLAAQALNKAPASAGARLLIAEICEAEGFDDQAVDSLESLRADQDQLTPEQLYETAELFLKMGRAVDAEALFRKLLAVDSSHHEARLRLMLLLRLERRHFELQSLVTQSVLTGDCPSEFLFATGYPDRVWIDAADQQYIDRLLKRNPDEYLIQLGSLTRGEYSTLANNLHSPETLLRDLINRHPHIVQAHVFLGELLVNSARWPELDNWAQTLPVTATEHPGIWYLLGLRAQRDNDTQAAMRCFWETLNRSPCHPGATYQLSRLLRGTRHAGSVAVFEEQARQLARLKELLVFGTGRGGFPSEATIRSICDILEQLGRFHETAGWCRIVLQRNPQSAWARETLRRLQPTLRPAGFLVHAESRLAQRIDLSDYPLPVMIRPQLTRPTTPPPHGPLSATPSLKFENVSEQAGLRFRYHIDFGQSDRTEQPPHAYMFEISAGGAAVLDYDRDEWPDIYLTQGDQWPPADRQSTLSDQLFRNSADGRFFNVTELSGIALGGFGQTPAVGDWNNDGWPDLLIANVGPNRLYTNNGDGTFSHVKQGDHFSGTDWSIGAVVADLNDDTAPDLYVVNYLEDAALKQQCEQFGHKIQCRPTMFSAQQDRVFFSDQTGEFRDATEAAGFASPHGKGMGVIVSDLDHSATPDVYVTNDTTANSLFIRTSQAGEPALFSDLGQSAGLSFGESGQTQASMGIATADVNNDGLPDLFVTNFTGQPNNLYVQTSPGVFMDQSRRYGLFHSSVPMMGWGACFLDADLDGDADLVVANGHLEDYSPLGITSRMNPQLFRHSGTHYEEVLPEERTGWFSGKRLARAVARLDWNRDRREDFVMSHVDDPAALLENTTELVGHGVAVQLVGTLSDRDAIGTRLRVDTEGQIHWAQAVAGGGYQASHEQHIVIGLGNVNTPSTLSITWPSGLQQTIHNIPIDSDVRVVEGTNQCFVLP
jgi:tetratricopeptide (TPR) repeat protein